MRSYLFSILFLLSCFSSIFCTKNFVLISAPGSGKGTFSQYLVERYKYVQICPGDLFRDEIAKQSALGKRIASIVNRGDYVDEDIVCNLIKNQVNGALREEKSFIIDGFPRSALSLGYLIDLLKKHQIMKNTYFVQFVASDETCRQRVLKRMVCPNCFRVFSRDAGVYCCTNCKTELSRRSADTEDIINKRLEYFHNNIEPLIANVGLGFSIIKISSDCTHEKLEPKYEQLLTK